MKAQYRNYLKIYSIPLLLLLSFFLLCLLFPFTGDDWAWGSRIGIERLETLFYNYNGRYTGNLVVLLLTRNRVLNDLVKSISYFLACLLCSRYVVGKRGEMVLFCGILFLLMPVPMLREAVVWTAGYSNYVPSALISILLLNYGKSLMEKPDSTNAPLLSIGWFILCFLGGMFMENITLFHVMFTGAILVFSWVRYHKVHKTQISMLAGSMLGAVCMFSNTAYLSIFQGNDTYRSTASGITGIFHTVIHHTVEILNFMISDNLRICAVVSLLLLLLYIQKRGTVKKGYADLMMAGNAMSLVGILLAFRYLGYFQKIVITCCSGVYLLTVVVLVLLLADPPRKWKLLLPLGCAVVVCAPLLLVNPIGPRCFFAAFLFLMAFAAELLDCCVTEAKKEALLKKLLIPGVGVFLAAVIFYISIFYPIQVCSNKRIDFARYQSDKGEKTVLVCELPNLEYLHCSSPASEPWTERFKLFYGLEEDVELKVVTSEELDAAIAAAQSP